MGININEVNLTEIILITIYITYSVVWWWPLPNFCPVPLASNLTMITKNRWFSKRVHKLVFFQRYRSRTSYHNRTDWVMYRINLVTWVPVELQQKTNLSLNNRIDPRIFLPLIPVCQMVPLLFCFFFFVL